jgi:fucose permease
LALLAAFVRRELRVDHPLIRMQIFRNRAFAVDNAVLFLLMIVFVPLFFFTSLYAQISLGDDASGAGLYLLVFFGGFAAGSQLGGRILDSRGARAAVVPGCVLAAVGFALWASRLTDFDLGDQWIYIVIAGAGVGLVLGPASTDAVNRAPRTSYGEATGILQTLRNFGSSLGLAVLGTVLILQNKANIESSLGALGVPKERADAIADALSQSGGGSAAAGFPEAAGRRAREVFAAVQHDFALSTRVVFYAMAGVMAVAFVVALVGTPGGRVEEVVEEPEPSPTAAG